MSLTNLTRGSEKIPTLSVLNERQKMDNKIEKIRELNDNLRQNFSGGRVILTRGVAGLPLATRLKIIQKVQSFNNFNASNDPYGEHDFGAFDFNGVTYFWKIDYYDHDWFNVKVGGKSSIQDYKKGI